VINKKKVMNMNQITRVKIKHGTGQQLAKMFHVTVRTVCNATSGASNSRLAQKIRIMAVNMGGDAIYD
jgi:hypothetical protein